MFKYRDKKAFKAAFITTIPVLLGYLAIGIAFGLLLVSAGYSWILAPIMSIVIYAGAGQYMAVALFARNAGFLEIASVIFLINSRHMVYGLSLIEKFKGAEKYKPYLIFSLTDETYALLTTVKVPEGLDKGRFYFYIALLDQFYWVMGGLIGALLGKLVNFNSKGIDFALTALFVVLLIEQYKNCRNKIPFLIAGTCTVCVLILIGPGNMLVLSIVSSIVVLILLKGFIKNDESR